MSVFEGVPHCIVRDVIRFVYYESIKRELKTRPIYECRCDERLKPKAEESTRLAYTGLFGIRETKRLFRIVGFWGACHVTEFFFLTNWIKQAVQMLILLASKNGEQRKKNSRE